MGMPHQFVGNSWILLPCMLAEAGNHGSNIYPSTRKIVSTFQRILLSTSLTHSLILWVLDNSAIDCFHCPSMKDSDPPFHCFIVKVRNRYGILISIISTCLKMLKDRSLRKSFTWWNIFYIPPWNRTKN